MTRPINPDADRQRSSLRALGLLLAVPGGILTAIGLFSFFGAFGGGSVGMPQYFWCAFLGLPMVAIGVHLLRLGYLGTIARYVAGETTPVATDTLNTVAKDTAPGVRDFTRAVQQGLTSGPGTTCPHCGSIDPGEGRFCDDCGKPIGSTACPQCHGKNAPEARFCTHCGATLPTP